MSSQTVPSVLMITLKQRPRPDGLPDDDTRDFWEGICPEIYSQIGSTNGAADLLRAFADLLDQD